jgi:hypothetical protein
MDISSFTAHAIGTTDTLAQVASSLYIAIAVFSGEQVATALKGQRPQIRINPRRYIEYLNLPKASLALIVLIALGPLYDTNLLPGTNAPMLKVWVGLVGLIGVLAWLYFIVEDTLIHRGIEKKFEHITGSTSRLIAWALHQEVAKRKPGNDKIKGKIEQLKLIATLLEHDNDVNLELYILKLLDDRLNDVIENPKANQKIAPSLLSALRSLHTNFDKRPIRDTQYYQQLFALSHVSWHKAFSKRKELSAQQIFQLPGILGLVGKELMSKSIADLTLGYDYARHATPFLAGDTQRAKDYIRIIGNDIEGRIADSPHHDFTEDPYMSELHTQLKKARRTQKA